MLIIKISLKSNFNLGNAYEKNNLIFLNKEIYRGKNASINTTDENNISKIIIQNFTNNTNKCLNQSQNYSQKLKIY